MRLYLPYLVDAHGVLNGDLFVSPFLCLENIMGNLYEFFVMMRERTKTNFIRTSYNKI